MRWTDWKPFYWRIVREMGYSVEADRKAARVLYSLLLRNDKYLLKEEINELIAEKVYVFGAGPSLGGVLERFDFVDGTLIAADGATSALIEFGLIPDLIVTDLDGRIADIKFANRRGALLVVHAHGDNVDKITSYVPVLSRILGTTQTEPFDFIYNFGGFTDGDRAVFLSEELGAREIVLVGFDFGEIVGRWSKPYLRCNSPVWETKKKKFALARELLRWLEKNGRAKITYLKT